MANDQHVAMLKKGVAAWNTWRDENSDIRPDLYGANLSRANLGGANLNGAILLQAKLVGANLVGAYLVGATLVVADLVRANLSRASMSPACPHAGARVLAKTSVSAHIWLTC